MWRTDTTETTTEHLAKALDEAKRRAAASFARTMRGDCKTAIDGWALDERAVLRARIDLLNALMRAGPDARLCLDSDKPPRVCVMYNRMRCEGQRELGPVQSTMAWAVGGAEKPVQHLMSTGELAQAGCLGELLGLIRDSMPRKKDAILEPLGAVLGLPPPERLVLKSVAGVNAQLPGHTRVMEGLGEQQNSGAPGLAPLYQVVWGALDLAAHEAWQNPSTNAAIRLSILDTAHQVAMEAVRSKDAPWSTVAHIQVRIWHGEECHVLSLTPFVDSESCTVTHLQYAQSVFDVHGPERGILNLAQDPASIHAMPGGKILPLHAYVCLGAHRKTRLSEAQLNYAHAQGLLAHGFPLQHLPPPDQLRFDQPGLMPAAKSTRVSSAGVDVLASSYHVADQVYTTISVVQYPPFGTQFERVVATPPPPRVQAPRRLQADHEEPAHDGRDSDNDMQSGSDEDHEPNPDFDYGDDSGSSYTESNEPVRTLYREPRDVFKDERFLTPALEKARAWKKKCWRPALHGAQFYFVDGVVGSPYDMNGRFILFDLGEDGRNYDKPMKKMCAVRSMLLRDCRDCWLPHRTFYCNININTRYKNVQGETVQEVWQRNWKHFLAKDVTEIMDSGLASEPLYFWYTNDPNNWKQILIAQPARAVEYANWVNYQMEDKPFLRSHLEAMGISPPSSGQLDQLQIPIPAHLRLKAPKEDKAALAELNARICALETRLQREKQDANTQALLAQVLERLEV